MILNIINQNVSVFCSTHISKDERQIILIYVKRTELGEYIDIPAWTHNFQTPQCDNNNRPDGKTIVNKLLVDNNTSKSTSKSAKKNIEEEKTINDNQYSCRTDLARPTDRPTAFNPIPHQNKSDTRKTHRPITNLKMWTEKKKIYANTVENNKSINETNCRRCLFFPSKCPTTKVPQFMWFGPS